MSELLQSIENYWDNRSDGYSQVNIEELNSFKRQAWSELIHSYAPQRTGKALKVLDIGTGPGFFAIIMAEQGHQVTAVDYTQAMLDKAMHNAGCYRDKIRFARMDAHNLDFPDNSFDLIITRNLTWTLERPADAYRDWYRVLDSNGLLLNFDANWYLHVHDEQKRQEYEQDRLNTQANNLDDHYTCTDTEAMENIAVQLPLSRIKRPAWDVSELKAVGFKKLLVDTNIGQRVWDNEEQINYGSTPMFMIGAEK